MVTKRRSDHLDLHLSAPGGSTHTGKYFECSIPGKLRNRGRGSVVMAQAQSDRSYMCTGSHQDGVLDMGSQWKDSDTHSYDGYTEVGQINGLFYSYLLILRRFHVFQVFVFSSRGILGDFTESPHG